MKELLIDIYEILVNDKKVIISIVKKSSKYIVEKCIVNNECIDLIYKETFNTIKDARMAYKNLIATR